MSTPLGIAIIGSGIFVKREHLPAVLASNLVSLKAIWSRSLQSAQDTAALIPSGHRDAAVELYSADSPGKTLPDLLRRSDISGVIIALPILAQPAIVEQALAAGKHVLMEKPVAGTTSAAKALLRSVKQYRESDPGATLSVAENFRFFPKWGYAAAEARKMGAVQQFSVRVMFRIDERDNAYYHTAWRKTPKYQGGFVLDTGVHFAAATRLMLAGHGDNAPVEVLAASHQVEPHLPPVDSVAAIIRTKGGGTGTFQVSVGSRLSASEWHFGYEGGSISVTRDEVVVKRIGEEEHVEAFAAGNGVPQELEAWVRGAVEGRADVRQSVEEAVNDLEFVEKVFASGDQGGVWQSYDFI